MVTGVAPQTAVGRIVGVVHEQQRHRSIEGVRLVVRGTDVSAVSDAEGNFVLEPVPAGTRVLEVSGPGYQTRKDSLEVLPDRTLELEIPLAPEPIPLEPLLVTVRSRVLEDSGFYDRRGQGVSGTMLTRREIEERNPARLSDLFVSIPGMRLAQRDGVQGPIVVVPRGNLIGRGRTTCHPRVWIDGVPTTIIDLDQVRPGQVEGMEVYTGVSTPIAYNDPCGAIVIWTRLPGGGRIQKEVF